MKRLAVAGSLAVLAVSAGLLLRTGPSAMERLHAAPFEQVGRVLAAETVRVLGGRGGIVVLRTRVATDPADTVLGPATETFFRVLGRAPGLRILATEEDEYNPLDQEAGWTRTTMEPARFAAFLERHRDADAVVLLGGTPRLRIQDLEKLPSPRPRIVSASILTTPERWLLEERVIDSAIVLQPHASTERRPPATPEEAFARRYLVVTAGHAGALP
jgi:hypothetical protein